jgi:hypothetical protein
VCLIREVLQHLSNAQILKVLPKLQAYRWVLVTERHMGATPNVDQSHGAPTRVGSGVYLEQKPFSIPNEKLRLVAEIDPIADEGTLRTYLYFPGGPASA